MSPNGMDEYRQLDAAYVLGSLSPSERQEFEEHLAGCDACAAAVVELAGLPGLLAVLTPTEAEAVKEVGAAPTPPGLLAGLTEKVRRSRQRTRLAVAVLVLGAGAASAGLTVALTAPAPPAAQTQAATATRLKFDTVAPGPLTATGSITAEPWGTRIDWMCSYVPSPEDLGSRPDSRDAGVMGYSLVVVDSRGSATQVASWAAGPGTVVAPTATTSTPATQIRSVEIRSLASGRTLLAARN